MQDIMEKNVDYVAFIPKRESSWNFYIAGKAITLSETFDEILGVTKKLFDITHGFFIPTEINCIVSIEPGEMPANHVFTDVKPLDLFDRKIKFDTGISFQELINDVKKIDTPKDRIKQLRRITLNGKTKFVLKSKDEFIDGNSKGLYAFHGYEKFLTLQQVLDSQHPDNPLSISIIRSLSKGDGQRLQDTDPAYYHILFRTYTDMWFEKTDIGLANRTRLRNVFKKIYDNFEVVNTSFTSDWYSEEEVTNIVFGQY